MSEFSVRSAILCEMCRQEVANKTSIIGVFSADVMVRSFPAALPLSAYIEIYGVPKGHHKFGFRISVPGSVMEGTADLDTGEGDVGSLPFPMAMLTAKEAGEINVQIRLDDGEWQTLITRKIILGERS